MPNFGNFNLNDLVFADETQYDPVDPCDCDVCRPRPERTEDEMRTENRKRWLPDWLNVDNIVDTTTLHSNRDNCMNTMEIGYAMNRARIRVLDDRNAAHLYARMWLLDKMGALGMTDSNGVTRSLRKSDVFARIGLVNGSVPEDARPLSWDRFVSTVVGPAQDTNLRADFRRYMRDQGAH